MSHIQKDTLCFLPLGGSGEIGMNLNLYHYQDRWLMVDLGISFERALGIDVVMPDPSYIVKKKDKLEGLVLTHAHEDHIGAIPYLWAELGCPIYATPFTAYLVREKLRAVGRLGEAKIIEVKPGTNLPLGPFQIEYIPITHSIPEANVIKITTDAGTIVHTGDWKLDEIPLLGSRTHVDRLKEVGDQGVLALLCDSTNVFEEGRSGSENEVRESLIEIIKKQKRRVAVTCFSSNVARLLSCLEAAQRSHRKIVVSGRSLWSMIQAAEHCGYIRSSREFLGEEALFELPPEKVLLMCTGSQGEPRAVLSRIAYGTHPKVRLHPGDTVIFSSREIPGNEPAIHAIQDNLIEQGIQVITDYDEFTHVSGHPNQDELGDMYAWIRPQILIPVHGERSHLREHAAFGLEKGIPQTLAPRNGNVIALTPAGPQILETVEHGRLALDGMAIVPLRGENVLERERLMTCGAVFITLVVEKKNLLKAPVTVSVAGLPDIGSGGSLGSDIEWAVREAINHLGDRSMDSEDHMREAITQAVRRLIKGLLGKKPLVFCHIISPSSSNKG